MTEQNKQQTDTQDQGTTSNPLDQDFREKRQKEFAKAHNHEAIDKHWDKVKKHETTIEQALRMRPIVKAKPDQVIDYETARGYVIRIIREMYGDKYTTNDQIKTLLTNMTKYFICDPSCQLDLEKGILLYGGVGTGKTTLFRIFKRLADALDIKEGYNRAFAVEKTNHIVLDVRERPNEVNISKYFNGNICFDDLGQEASDAKVYGNTVSVMGDILFNRYDRFQNNGILTHATTNLSEKELADKYGERIHSRAVEMFNWIQFDGKDLRK